MSSLPIFAAGLSLFVYSYWYALQMKDELQAAHHAKSYLASALAVFTDETVLPVTSIGPTTSSGHSLPPMVILATILSSLCLIYGGIGSFFKLHPIHRKYYAAKQSYDESYFTGKEFMHFNHRGRAIVVSSNKKSSEEEAAATASS